MQNEAKDRAVMILYAAYQQVLPALKLGPRLAMPLRYLAFRLPSRTPSRRCEDP